MATRYYDVFDCDSAKKTFLGNVYVSVGAHIFIPDSNIMSKQSDYSSNK